MHIHIKTTFIAIHATFLLLSDIQSDSYKVVLSVIMTDLALTVISSFNSMGMHGMQSNYLVPALQLFMWTKVTN